MKYLQIYYLKIIIDRYLEELPILSPFSIDTAHSGLMCALHGYYDIDLLSDTKINLRDFSRTLCQKYNINYCFDAATLCSYIAKTDKLAVEILIKEFNEYCSTNNLKFDDDVKFKKREEIKELDFFIDKIKNKPTLYIRSKNIKLLASYLIGFSIIRGDEYVNNFISNVISINNKKHLDAESFTHEAYWLNYYIYRASCDERDAFDLFMKDYEKYIKANDIK